MIKKNTTPFSVSCLPYLLVNMSMQNLHHTKEAQHGNMVKLLQTHHHVHTKFKLSLVS